MNLPFFKRKPSVVKREYFFALEINHTVIKSAVWGVYNDRSQAIAVGSPAIWDGSSDSSLISACDSGLSDSSLRLDPTGKTQISKVILGLPPHWLSADKILPQHQQTLKNIVGKLSLTAVGYVVTPEAIVKFLQHQEGVPPTVILMSFCPGIIDITLVRLGKIDSTQMVKRSPKVIDDVVEGLSRFSHVDMLPSRILIYDSGLDLEEVKQALLGHPWQSPQTRLPFLHFPKIEILPSDYSIRAISQAGGTEVAQSIGLIPDPVESRPEPQASAVSPQDLGFTSQIETVSTPPAPAPPIPQTVLPPAKKRFRLTLPRFSLPTLKFPAKFSPIIFLPLAILLFLAAFLFYWYYPRVNINLSVASRNLEHQFELIADPAIRLVDPDKNIIPAKSVETVSSSAGSIPATGTKLIGDKAAGVVTIINGTSLPRIFPAGTVISSPSGLKFTLDSQVQIASASGTADPNSYLPGKTDVNVTASQIGSDSNISAGTQFRIGSFATLDFVAKNSAAFSGGSSREVKAISKSDISRLREDLASQLKNQAKLDLESLVSSGDNRLVADSLQLQTVSEEFDHRVDDVADTLNLKLSIKAKGISYSVGDLQSLVSRQTQSLIPEGFILSADPEYELIVKKIDRDLTTLVVNLSASLLPQYDKTRIVQSIVGKKIQIADEYLRTLPGITKAAFSFNLTLPPVIQTLPHVPSRINITVLSEP